LSGPIVWLYKNQIRDKIKKKKEGAGSDPG